MGRDELGALQIYGGAARAAAGRHQFPFGRFTRILPDVRWRAPGPVMAPDGPCDRPPKRSRPTAVWVIGRCSGNDPKPRSSAAGFPSSVARCPQISCARFQAIAAINQAPRKLLGLPTSIALEYVATAGRWMILAALANIPACIVGVCSCDESCHRQADDAWRKYQRSEIAEIPLGTETISGTEVHRQLPVRRPRDKTSGAEGGSDILNMEFAAVRNAR